MSSMQAAWVLECKKSNISADNVCSILSMLRVDHVDGCVKEWAEFLLKHMEINCAYKKNNFIKKNDLAVILEFMLEFFEYSNDMRFLNVILKYLDYRRKHSLGSEFISKAESIVIEKTSE